MARSHKRDEHWDAALEALRAVCGALPEVTESLSFGNPAFKVGRKTFAVLDTYRNATCVWLLCGPDRREQLLSQPEFFPSPYDRTKVAVCRIASTINWPAFADLVRECYERAV
jgi:predicted DNA-binding protein (MmcQ/YjbR family)